MSLMRVLGDILFGPQPRLRIILGTRPETAFLGRWPQQMTLDDGQNALHKHILGVAGSGKSKLMESLFLQYFRRGIGTTLVDPHGTSIESILGILLGLGYFDKEPRAFERLLYLEFADGDSFFPLNILKAPFATEGERAKLVIEAMVRVWPELQQAAMFQTLTDACLKVLLANDLPVVMLYDILKVKEVREDLLLAVDDHLVRSFFDHSWNKLSERDQVIEGGAAIRRAYLLVSSPVTRLTLGQQENGFDARRIMDEGVSVLINLGRVKDGETRRLLGAILTHSYEVAALSRLPRTDLPIHQLLIDEFSQFSAPSSEALANMLDQTRKAGLFLTMAHQTWSQTNVRLTGALQNAMVKVSFRVGHEDAMLQAKAFADIDLQAIIREAPTPNSQPMRATVQDQYEVMAGRLRALPRRHALVRVETQPAVELETLPLPEFAVDPARIEELKREYLRRYYVKREDIVLPFNKRGGGQTVAQRVIE